VVIRAKPECRVRAAAISVTVAVSLLVVGVPASPARAQGAPTVSDADLAGVVITLQRTVCFGRCPAYEVKLYGDGRVLYWGTQFVKEKGKREGHVDKDAVRQLVAAFEQAGYFSLREKYTADDCRSEGSDDVACSAATDMPSATTSLTLRGKTHRVNHYYGCSCAPKVLEQLESLIDRTAQTDQWIGTRAEQVR
jgi:hypothetical protein